MTAPVLLMGYNRPRHLERVLARVRESRTPTLFLSVDGPRADRKDDVALTEASRGVAGRVDWPCELHTRFASENHGCKRSVETALDWFFAHVDAGIVLEDDCLPDASFFAFCTELLERLRDDEHTMMIAGHNQVGRIERDTSYVFSRATPIWGWATWRRAWGRYDAALERWDVREIRRAIASRMSEEEFRLAAERFEAVRRRGYDTWDFGWELTVRSHDCLSAIPVVNLVENIGFGSGATHTTRPWRHERVARAGRLPRPLVHPRVVRPDEEHDRLLFECRFPPERRRTGGSLVPPAG